MSRFPNKSYIFDDFIFDAEKLAFYHRNRLVKNTDKKSLQVLSVLLQNANQLTSHDEMVREVWKDNPLGVTSTHIAQYIGKLRKILAEFEPDKKFIENVKGRGYMFVGELVSERENFLPDFSTFSFKESISDDQSEKNNVGGGVSRKSAISRKIALFGIVSVISLLTFLAWFWFPQDDEGEIKRVVEDSQKFESLVLYRNPQAAADVYLEKYWLPEANFETGLDITRIRAGVGRLIIEGKYYGEETKPEQFEIQSIEINEAGDFAVAKTLEKWFIAEYLTDGTLHKNKTVGPYFVTYTLRKTGGQWLIEKSTTARAKPLPNTQ